MTYGNVNVKDIHKRSIMKVSAAARGRARRIAMQGLYQWHMTANPLHIIEAECHVENDMTKVDKDYFHELMREAVKQHKELDGMIEKYADGLRLDQLDPISLAVLRMSVYELKARVDVPYRVCINEAINLTKKYGAADSHKFINGVLDKIAPTLRAAETLNRQR